MSDASPLLLRLAIYLVAHRHAFPALPVSSRSHIDDKSTSDLDSARLFGLQLLRARYGDDWTWIRFRPMNGRPIYKLPAGDLYSGHYTNTRGAISPLNAWKRGELRHNQDASSSDAAKRGYPARRIPR